MRRICRAVDPAVCCCRSGQSSYGSAWRVLARQLRNGVVAASSRETGRFAAREAPQRPTREHRLAAGHRRATARAAVAEPRPKLFWCRRWCCRWSSCSARSFSRAACIRPSLAGVSDAAVASIAFGIAAYTLMMSAFQTLNSEGGALWLLFTIPRSIESILREKARLWASSRAGLSGCRVRRRDCHQEARRDRIDRVRGHRLLGVPIYTVIAVVAGRVWLRPLGPGGAHQTSSDLCLSVHDAGGPLYLRHILPANGGRKRW